MHFSISDEMVSQFMSGLVAVLALVAVGCTLALILGRMTRRFPFSRLALVFALSPLAFVRVLEYEGNATLHLYAMIVILLGITIDGLAYLLVPRKRPAEKAAKEVPEEESAPIKAPKKGTPRIFLWKKAE